MNWGIQTANLPEKAAFYGVILCWWGFILAFWVRKRPAQPRTAKRDPTSYVGLLLQAVGYFLVWLRPLHRQFFFPPDWRPRWLAWVLTAISLGLAAISIVLVVWSARHLGKQWSLGARVVEGHDLIQDGPYSFVRNPIYTGMLGMLIGTGLVFDRWIVLLLAVALFLAGTWIRIRVEERLLREAFGTRFDDYAHKVRALIPWFF